ncbi:MAG TPA: Rid family hydrolase [bacterium]|nr:Rid family hydrolase [bacterium]
MEQTDADLMLIYSTQWLSVIGTLFQADPAPEWTLVDQNWYEYGSMPYKLRVDADFSKAYCEATRELGLTASTVNYYGFPIDTGTVVAALSLNPTNRLPLSMVSCNMYAEREETVKLGIAGRLALERTGKRAIVCLVSALSNRYHVHRIDPAEDRISSLKDDEWNRKLLEMLGEGRLEDTAQVAREVARQANGDMGFKGIWWLAAITGQHNRFTGKVYGYAPVWGTGAAVVSLTPALKETLEKESDEIAIPTSAEQARVAAPAAVTVPSSPAPVRGPVAPLAAAVEPIPAIRANGQHPAVAATVVSESAPEPVGPYPHAKRVGNLLFVSGIGPRKRGSKEIPGVTMDAAGHVVAHDIRMQTRSCIENIQAILRDAGLSLANVVDVQAFLTDLDADFAGFNEVYGEYFREIAPTRTTVEVEKLPTPINVELKVIAVAQ